MSECQYCFSKDGEAHLECCPVVRKEHPNSLSALKTGTELDRGRYIIGTMLNQGGFGITYVCKDKQSGKRLVMKEFFPDRYAHRMIADTKKVAFSGMDNDSLSMMQQQFYREFDIMYKVSCPGVPRVYSFFPENSTAYYAMDFIPGMTFKKYLMKQKGPLPWWYLRNQFFYPLLDIISSIHRKGILHRDISLVNLMITPDNRIFLLDFGAGRDFHERDTVERLRFANKMYAPIEQTNPEYHLPQGPWTDIFAMGTVFYTAITKHYPPMALERPQKAVESAQIYIPDLPEPIDDALEKSLFYYPKHRFQRTEDFWAALASCPDPENIEIGNPVGRNVRGVFQKIRDQLNGLTRTVTG